MWNQWFPSRHHYKWICFLNERKQVGFKSPHRLTVPGLMEPSRDVVKSSEFRRAAAAANKFYQHFPGNLGGLPNMSENILQISAAAAGKITLRYKDLSLSLMSACWEVLKACQQGASERETRGKWKRHRFINHCIKYVVLLIWSPTEATQTR